MKNVLLIVDPQNDFITGSLAVEGAKEKMMKLAEYIENEGHKYDYICITMDTHPNNHCSFEENGGIWPKHCVFFTNGWYEPGYLHSALLELKLKGFKERRQKVYYYYKGTKSDKEEYSVFDNIEYGPVLSDNIKNIFREDSAYIDICGIAGDYCVLETLKGLRKIIEDKHITVLTQYTASIDGGEKLMNYIKENDISYK